jgi:outer membrane lipoprotein-sorting protein
MLDLKSRCRATVFFAVLVAALLLASWSGAATAAEAVPATLSEADRTDLARIEAYLNGLTTMESRFLQFSEGGVAEGRIMLDRPGRLRIEYAPPVPVLMIASGRLLMYHDTQLKQTTFLPVSETPAALLIDENIVFSGNVTVTAFERTPKAFRVTLEQTDSSDTGSVTLMFEDAPMRLAKWRVIDAQGTSIDVSLLEPRFGVAFEDANELFSTVDPNSVIQ